MPKRPLSAYNIFFRRQREDILGEDIAREFEITDQTKRKHRKTHGKIGFAEMARIISNKWKGLSEADKKPFMELAEVEKKKYIEAVEAWKKTEAGKESIMQEAARREAMQKGGRSDRDPAKKHPASPMVDISEGNPMVASLPHAVMDPSQALPSQSSLPMGSFARLSRASLMSNMSAAAIDPASRAASLPASYGAASAMQLSPGQGMTVGLTSPPRRFSDPERDRLMRLEHIYRLHLQEAAAVREELEHAGYMGQAREQEMDQMYGNTMAREMTTLDRARLMHQEHHQQQQQLHGWSYANRDPMLAMQQQNQQLPHRSDLLSTVDMMDLRRRQEIEESLLMYHLQGRHNQR